MAEIVASGILYYVLCVAAISFVRPIEVRVLLTSMIYLVVLLTMAVINFEYDLIEQKFASTFSYERYLGEVTRLNSNFLFQGIFSSLAFALTDAWYAAIGVNVAVIAALFLFSDRLRVPFLLIFLAPGMMHIAIFALRDVLLAATLFLFCFYSLSPIKPRIFAGVILTGLLAMQRPELVAIVAVSVVAIKFREFSTLQKSALAVFSIGASLVALPQIPVVLGLPAASSILDVPELLLNFSQVRGDRWTGTDGANTAILGGQLTSIPIFFRYPIQVVAFFFSPLPMDFNSVESVVFLIDSIIFLWLFKVFWRTSHRRFKIFLMAYILINAFFMANYGNLFRLRMPCFLIMFAGMLHYLNSRTIDVMHSDLGSWRRRGGQTSMPKAVDLS